MGWPGNAHCKSFFWGLEVKKAGKQNGWKGRRAEQQEGKVWTYIKIEFFRPWFCYYWFLIISSLFTWKFAFLSRVIPFLLYFVLVLVSVPGGLDQMTSSDSFQPQPGCDSLRSAFMGFASEIAHAAFIHRWFLPHSIHFSISEPLILEESLFVCMESSTGLVIRSDIICLSLFLLLLLMRTHSTNCLAESQTLPPENRLFSWGWFLCLFWVCFCFFI